jgi:ribosomal protein S18 acetylase RimI-like enzyme
MIDVELAAPDLAADEAFVRTIVDLVNDAYNHAEAGLWTIGHTRTDVEETSRAAAAGHLVVAYRDGQIVGAIQTRALDEHTGWFGALAADPTMTGQGIGAALVAHAEARCVEQGCVRMQLERLAPKEPHPHTDRVWAWYRRLGYTETSRRDLADADPTTASFQRQPCEIIVCHKPLR